MKRERENALKSGNLGSYDALINQLKKEHGRIPLGEKGVGRFATHRLGRYLELRTKTKDVDYELVLKIDWDKFDKVSSDFVNLNSIGISLFKETPKRDYGEKNSGTKLIIYGGKEGFEWKEKEIRELNSSILNLNSPNYEQKIKAAIRKKNEQRYPAFSVFLECPQIKELPRRNVYEDSIPNFSFDIWVNEEGIADSYILKFQHPKEKIPNQKWTEENIDLRNDPKYWKLKTKKKKPRCGKFYMHLDIWYRKSEWIDLSDWNSLTNYLNEYGGVSIYRDGVLVLESKMSSEFDWLELAKEHIKQVDRLSYRDMIGCVEIDQISNYIL